MNGQVESNDTYVEISVSCPNPFSEILIAELGQINCDIFEEFETGFCAYMLQVNFQEALLNEIFEYYKTQAEISWGFRYLPKENWNEQWEKNYQPILIADEIYIRAPFHPQKPEVLFNLTISPKMSFGTGHHPTTATMLQTLLNIDCMGKTVYDIGAGTGVLAILASKKGAKKIVATDVDDWCIENCLENFALNDVTGEVMQGQIAKLQFTEKADILLANINLNILLDEFSLYDFWLKPKGTLLLSGFYESDASALLDSAKNYEVQYVSTHTLDNWCVLVFKKKTLT